MNIIDWLRDFDPDNEVQQVPVQMPDFNWDSPNLQGTFRLFTEQVTPLIKGPWENLEDDDKISTFLNWRSILYSVLVFGIQKSNEKFGDVLEAFQLHFKPPESIYQLWYLLGSCYSGAYENQAAFMKRHNEIAGEHGFTTKNEVVQLMLLIYNHDSEVYMQ